MLARFPLISSLFARRESTLLEETELSKINYFLTRLKNKELVLIKESSDIHSPQVTKGKAKIFQDLNNALTQVKTNWVEVSGDASEEDKLKNRRQLLVALRNTLNANLQEQQLKLLLIKRNNNQYYVNMAVGATYMSGGIALNVMFPNNFFSFLANYMTSFEFTLACLTDSFNSFVPESVKLIYEFVLFLAGIETKLAARFDKVVPTKSLYDVLGIEKTATPSEIKKAYLALAKVHHPDKNGDPELFKEITKAKETLLDSNKRELYDSSASNFKF